MSRRLAIIEGQRAALAYATPDPGQARRVRALEAENAALRRQVAELGHAPPALTECNAKRQAASERLRAALAAVLAADQHPQAITAKEALQALRRNGWTTLPSVRTTQRHLDALRHTACGVRSA